MLSLASSAVRRAKTMLRLRRSTGSTPRPGKWCLMAGLMMAALVAAGYQTSPAVARAPSSSGSPKRLVAQYIADLNAHHYRAAYALEAPCSETISVSNGAGGPSARIGLAGRGPYMSARPLSYLRRVRIARIGRFRTPLLARLRFAGIRVNGRFTFSYPQSDAGNNERPSGYHRAILIVRPCGGRWWVDSNWLDEGGPFNWGQITVASARRRNETAGHSIRFDEWRQRMPHLRKGRGRGGPEDQVVPRAM